jgi:predicted dienelactone hydrolase
MRTISVIAAVLMCSAIFAQDYTIGHINTIFSDGLSGKRNIPADIFYPQPLPEDGGAEGVSYKVKFPVICFAHGYMLPSSAYLNIQEALVPAGYILVFPGSASGLFPSHEQYSEDLAFVLGAIDSLAADASSPLHGITDASRCLMGHSMGGGAVFAAANMHVDITAIVALAPLNTSPSAIQAASSVTAPTLIVAGGNDCITPPEKHQLPIYNFSASAKKTYLLIKGATHCQMGSHNSLCKFGETLAFCNDGISEEEQHLTLNRYLLPWLNFYMKGDYDAGLEFDSTIRSDISVEYLRSRPLVSAGDQCAPIF